MIDPVVTDASSAHKFRQQLTPHFAHNQEITADLHTLEVRYLEEDESKGVIYFRDCEVVFVSEMSGDKSAGEPPHNIEWNITLPEEVEVWRGKTQSILEAPHFHIRGARIISKGSAIRFMVIPATSLVFSARLGIEPVDLYQLNR